MIETYLSYLVLVPVVLAIVELIKLTFPTLPSRFYALLSTTVGVLVVVLYAWSLGSFDSSVWFAAVLVGLSASGLYSGVKSISGN